MTLRARSLIVVSLVFASRAMAQLPALSIRQTGPDVMLSSPAAATGWVLQSTSEVTDAGIVGRGARQRRGAGPATGVD